MRVIVVGCGKVGKTIANELVKEGHDIVLVDNNEELVEEVTDSIDALGIIGNGASLNTLKEAGVETADILIAVTNADEINMLCCLFAKKANASLKTIARVRNPMYTSEINYIKDELGLTMTINPEMITAREISRLIRWPSALKVDSFVRGKIELISFAVSGNKNRLGNGKGYYDRFLAKYDCPKIGVGFKIQELKEVPNEKFDRKLDIIYSEVDTFL